MPNWFKGVDEPEPSQQEEEIYNYILEQIQEQEDWWEDIQPEMMEQQHYRWMSGDELYQQRRDDIINDPNMPMYTRTQIWNIVSMLESVKREL